MPKPLRSNPTPEHCELGRVIERPPFLDVADHPQSEVVPQSPVELSVAGYLFEPLGLYRFEDFQWVSGGSAGAFLVVCFLDCFFDVV